MPPDARSRCRANESRRSRSLASGAGRSVAGGDLRLGGGTYDKGSGMHSRSRATYAVPAGATRFEAVVGLDEVSGRSGGVQIQLLADGKPLLDPPPELSAGESPRSL